MRSMWQACTPIVMISCWMWNMGSHSSQHWSRPTMLNVLQTVKSRKQTMSNYRRSKLSLETHISQGKSSTHLLHRSMVITTWKQLWLLQCSVVSPKTSKESIKLEETSMSFCWVIQEQRNPNSWRMLKKPSIVPSTPLVKVLQLWVSQPLYGGTTPPESGL